MLFSVTDMLFCFRCLCNGHADKCNDQGRCTCQNNTEEECQSNSDRCYKYQASEIVLFMQQIHLLKADLDGSTFAYHCRMRFLVRALLASCKKSHTTLVVQHSPIPTIVVGF